MDPSSADNFTYFEENEIHQEVNIDLISPQTYYQVIKYILSIRILVCLAGLCTNGLNIRTFLRIGLKDSVTLAFFALSISDLGILALGLGFNVCQALSIVEQDMKITLPVPAHYLSLYFFYSGGIFNTTTVLLTALLALQRSLCVARPFQFKDMFTRRSISIFILTITTCSAVFMIIYMSKHDLKRVMNPSTNSSIYILLYKKGRDEMTVFLNMGLGIVLNSICQVISGGSVVVMSYFLKKSVRFRQTTTVQTGQTDSNAKSDQMDSNADEKEKLANSKEKQAVVQVLLLSIIFIAANSPFLALSFLGLIMPEFNSPRMLFTNYTCYQFKFLFDYVNSAVNFFVYYNYNTKFKSLCFSKSK